MGGGRSSIVTDNYPVDITKTSSVKGVNNLRTPPPPQVTLTHLVTTLIPSSLILRIIFNKLLK